jgi:tetratricopeptide (TPR) repeat protein
MQDKISEGPLARECFVNREEVIKTFLSRIHNPQPDILFLHGEGGIGKSRLLDHLEANFCRHLRTENTSLFGPWERLEKLQARELVERFRDLQTVEIPTARLNFGSIALGKDPQEAFEGLTQIRVKLGLPTERFQAACLIYLKMEGRLTKEAISRIFPGEHAATLASLVDGLSPNGLLSVAAPIFSGVTLAVSVVDPHAAAGTHLAHVTLSLVNTIWASSAKLLGPSIETWRAKRTLRKSRFDDPNRFKPEDIIDLLPDLLAEDLNVWLEAGLGNFVLLFDSYQSFFSSQHFSFSGDRSSPDWWLRRFLSALDLQKGAVVVGAGQEPPRGMPAIRCRPFALSDLEPADANLFLQKAGVEPDSLRRSILRYAATEGTRVQPLLCALVADLYRLLPSDSTPPDFDVLSMNDAVQGKLEEVVERIVATSDTHIRYAIRAMAAPRRFDWDLYRWVGKETDFYSVSRAAFDTLSALSCVRVSQDGSFMMHSLLRRSFGGPKADEEVQKACLDYFSRPGASTIEGIYHLYFLAPEEAIASWIDQFREAASASRHAECAEFLTIRREIGESFAVQYSDEVGEYLGSLSRQADAEAEFNRSVRHWQALVDEAREVQNYLGYGNALARWADLLAARSEDEAAEKKYAQAEESFDRALALAPDSDGALNNKGNALASWANLLAARGQAEAAEEKYARAAYSCDRALALTPDRVGALNNKGRALVSWGNLLAARGQAEAEEEKYAQATDSCGRALALAPDFVGALKTRGDALHSEADLLAVRSEHEAAEKKYAQATDSFESALELAPDDVGVLNKKGNALQRWAQLLAKRGEHEAAVKKYACAVASYDRALALVPDVLTLSNKGCAFANWGKLLEERSEHEAVEEKYAQATASFDRAVALTSDDFATSNNMGNALRSEADLVAARSEKEAAKEKYAQAIASYDRALALAPNYAAVLNNKSLALQNWADLLAARSEKEAAKKKYAQAVDFSDREESRVPDFVSVLNNKGNALQGWADLRLSVGDEAGATDLRDQAKEVTKLIDRISGEIPPTDENLRAQV